MPSGVCQTRPAGSPFSSLPASYFPSRTVGCSLMHKGYDPCPSGAKFSWPAGAVRRRGLPRAPDVPRRRRHAPARAASARRAAIRPSSRPSAPRWPWSPSWPWCAWRRWSWRWPAQGGPSTIDLRGASTRRSCVVTSEVSPRGMTLIPDLLMRRSTAGRDTRPTAVSLLASGSLASLGSPPRRAPPHRGPDRRGNW